MTFTPQEMANIFRAAKNKREQLRIFMDTECLSKEEVRDILIGAGIDPRSFPRNGHHRKKSAEPQEAAETAETAEPLNDTTDEQNAEVSEESVLHAVDVNAIIDAIAFLKFQRDDLTAALERINRQLDAIITAAGGVPDVQ